MSRGGEVWHLAWLNQNMGVLFGNIQEDYLPKSGKPLAKAEVIPNQGPIFIGQGVETRWQIPSSFLQRR